MQLYIQYILIAILAYLLGAIPFGLLIGKARGVDIREVGSRNIGATNVFRTVGKKYGLLAFLLDFSKGLLGALGVPTVVCLLFGGDCVQESELIGGTCAIVGHTWPIYLRFRGGKGVATSAGVLLGVAPVLVGIVVGVWLLVLILSRYVSVASISAALALAALSWMPLLGTSLPSAVVFTTIAVLVILRHRANMLRLANGTESRFAFTKKQKERCAN